MIIIKYDEVLEIKNAIGKGGKSTAELGIALGYPVGVKLDRMKKVKSCNIESRYVGESYLWFNKGKCIEEEYNRSIDLGRKRTGKRLKRSKSGNSDTDSDKNSKTNARTRAKSKELAETKQADLFDEDIVSKKSKLAVDYISDIIDENIILRSKLKEIRELIDKLLTN